MRISPKRGDRLASRRRPVRSPHTPDRRGRAGDGGARRANTIAVRGLGSPRPRLHGRGAVEDHDRHPSPDRAQERDEGHGRGRSRARRDREAGDHPRVQPPTSLHWLPSRTARSVTPASSVGGGSGLVRAPPPPCARRCRAQSPGLTSSAHAHLCRAGVLDRLAHRDQLDQHGHAWGPAVAASTISQHSRQSCPPHCAATCRRRYTHPSTPGLEVCRRQRRHLTVPTCGAPGPSGR